MISPRYVFVGRLFLNYLQGQPNYSSFWNYYSSIHMEKLYKLHGPEFFILVY